MLRREDYNPLVTIVRVEIQGDQSRLHCKVTLGGCSTEAVRHLAALGPDLEVTRYYRSTTSIHPTEEYAQ